MAAPSSRPYLRLGEQAFASMEKINAELLTMTYGAIVTQLLKDYQDVDVVNKELEKMGYNIGIRLVDEFLAKSNVERCTTLQDTADVIAKIAFKMFLGIIADATKWSEDQKQFSLVFKGNPLDEFVEIPPQFANLQYSNILCGVIRGALNMVNLVVDCQFVQSELTGGDISEIRVTLKEVLKEVYQDEED